MDNKLTPRVSGKFIAERSTFVQVVEENMNQAAEVIYKRMTEAKYSMKTWKTHKLHPKDMDENTVNWIFVVDCLNFSFWVAKDKEPYKVSYNGEIYTDYEALCAVVNRALEENAEFTNPEYYKDITIKEAKKIFRSASASEIPLLEKRVAHLREAGEILNENFKSSVCKLVSSCNGSAVQLVKKLTTLFSSFKDEGVFEGQNVSFYKRAQIFVADLWACFEGQGYGCFKDIEELTMFADYRVPQCLLFLGILKYSDDLKTKIENEVEIVPGSREEMEIRGCSIHAVECLQNSIKSALLCSKKSINFRFEDLNSVIIDFYLWDYATLHADEMEQYPEHRTRTHFY